MKIDLSYTGALMGAPKDLNQYGHAPAFPKVPVTIPKEDKAYTVTLSNEWRTFADTEKIRMEDLYSKTTIDPDDPFSYKPKDQWLIFSQSLQEQGVFEGKSREEVASMEEHLKRITDGLDSLHVGGIDLAGGITRELDSFEAHLEYAASLSALSRFSEKFLSGDTQAGFNDLIDGYAKHNRAVVEHHSSLEERFFQARASIAVPDVRLTPEQAKEVRITNRLGKSDRILKDELVQTYITFFEGIRHGDDTQPAIDAVKKAFLSNILDQTPLKDREEMKEWLMERTSDTFERIGSYFAALNDR